MAGKRRQRFARQARRQGRLRYASEESALGLLERDARQDFRDTRASSRSAAQSIVGSAREGRRDIRSIYEDAGLTDLVRGALGSNPAARRIAEEMAEAETEMVNRGIDAREGAQFQIREARQQRDRALTDIGRRRTTLANEKGLFINDLLSQLIGEDNAARADARADRQRMQFEWDKQTRSLTQQERSSLRSSGVNPDTGRPTPAAKKKNWLPADSMRVQHSNISKAVAQAKRLKREGMRVADAVKTLGEGRPSYTVYVDRNGKQVPKTIEDSRGRRVENPDAIKQTIPEVPVFDELAARIALEAVFGRGITPQTRKRASQSGIRLRPLGLPFSPPPRPHPGVVAAPGIGGRQQRPG